jgi:putative lipoprotein
LGDTPGVTAFARRAPLALGTSLAICLNASPASAADDWWGEDKLLHFGVSVLLASGGYAASSFVLEEPWQRALAGGAFALSVGVAKEGLDLAGHGDPSWKDLTWDGAGMVVGVGFCFSLDAAFLTPAPRRQAPAGR